jgi:hypothetical protein
MQGTEPLLNAWLMLTFAFLQILRLDEAIRLPLKYLQEERVAKSIRLHLLSHCPQEEIKKGKQPVRYICLLQTRPELLY